ncbi:P-loop containing nucleoside triphosphate hydrolase protein [Chaetomium tenue]|uniref:P-loop containing nucleoside triphosphate hydrolase protein n=1 Tax=Chaetomium tenue TaxID=1854479 RepID=A0ACB7PAT3_9PEZI|nr:P-loop containing nucleoside triphosphate hydrolase protein [Chaetomium globosum]
MHSPRPLKPLLSFTTIEEFAARHKGGTEAEFAAHQKFIDETNKEDNKFQAWIISTVRQTTKRTEYLIAVQPGKHGEQKMPQLGEPAMMRLIFGDDASTRYWDCFRIESVLPPEVVVTVASRGLATFRVTAHVADSYEGIVPLVAHQTNKFENAVRANFLLTASEATKNAELNALEKLCGRHVKVVSERQLCAFHYFVTLRNPDFFVDLHEKIPHLTTAMKQPSWPGSPLAKKFDMLNPQQKAAYMHGFRKLDCGISILPGGPGAGKTHFNLFTIAMAQSQQLPRPVMIKGRLERRCPRVLFIVDMNSPVDDVANRMVALYKELGMKKKIIRMKGWGTEVSASDRLNAAEDAATNGVMTVDFTNQFLRANNLMKQKQVGSCHAPSLDEAAWQLYDEHRLSRYSDLTQYLSGDLWEESQVVPMRLRRLVYNLYRDTLADTDFIATTPVAASNHFNGMFRPELVYFDEAPHARELTNLVAIANFEPIAWIFCGDHRQTVPYVGSATPECVNIYREQMQVSMMKRASVANVIRYELLMNHRSFGGLHQLASTMWYDDRMVSGNTHTPAALTHMRSYLGGFKDGQACIVPRLVVHLKNCGQENHEGTSAWNPTHTAWVMKRVVELLNDKQFKHAERDQPGTILIMSPYKKAFNEYKKEIKKLPLCAQKRVETRTVDVAQGHEADFVFLDLAKSNSTRFLDNPNRLCVALTRARLGEIIMMHPHMVRSNTFRANSPNLCRIYSLCTQGGQVAHVDPTAPARKPSPARLPLPSPAPPVLAPKAAPAVSKAPSAVSTVDVDSVYGDVSVLEDVDGWWDKAMAISRGPSVCAPQERNGEVKVDVAKKPETEVRKDEEGKSGEVVDLLNGMFELKF